MDVALEEAMDLAVACVGGRPLDACWLKVARVLTFWGFGGLGAF